MPGASSLLASVQSSHPLQIWQIWLVASLVEPLCGSNAKPLPSLEHVYSTYYTLWFVLPSQLNHHLPREKVFPVREVPSSVPTAAPNISQALVFTFLGYLVILLSYQTINTFRLHLYMSSLFPQTRYNEKKPSGWPNFTPGTGNTPWQVKECIWEAACQVQACPLSLAKHMSTWQPGTEGWGWGISQYSILITLSNRGDKRQQQGGAEKPHGKLDSLPQVDERPKLWPLPQTLGTWQES